MVNCEHTGKSWFRLRTARGEPENTHPVDNKIQRRPPVCSINEWVEYIVTIVTDGKLQQSQEGL